MPLRSHDPPGIAPAVADDVNRVGLIVSTAKLAAFCYLLYSLIALIGAGDVTPEIVAGLLGAVCALVLAAWARLDADIRLVGNGLLGLGCVVLAFVNFIAGDTEIFGAAFMWYLIIPVVATFLFGRRHGLIWAIIVGIQIVGFLIAFEADVYAAGGAPAIRVRFLALVASLAFVTIVLSFYEKSRGESYAQMQTSLEELSDLNVELAASRDAAEAANQAKTEFLSTVSHEIRTPLNGVIGMAGVLGVTELDEQQLRFVATIERSGSALLTIINDILDLSKIEADEVEIESRSFDLIECIEESLDQVAVQASRKGLEIGYVIDPTTPAAVVGDLARLRQVLVNLVNNAVKFTPTGSVELSVDHQSDPQDKRTLLTFKVTDTGIGIPARSIDKLFKPFSQADSSTTRKFGGTGLGLTIAKQLVELMGGTIRVDSAEGEGSTFTFSTLVEVDTQAPPRHGSQDRRSDQVDPDHTITDWPVLVVYSSNPAKAVLCSHIRWLGGDPVAVGVERLTNGTIDPSAYRLIVTDDAASLPDKAFGDVPTVAVTDIHADVLNAAHGIVTRPVRTARLTEAIAVAIGHTTDEPVEAPTNEIAVEDAPISASTKQPPPCDALGPKPSEELRILVAEDDPLNQMVVQRILESIGLKATVVANGAEAVDAVRSSTFDVVLMDLRMPVLDGLQATQQILDECETRPHIIAVTANGLLQDPTAYVPLGIDDYLTKPVRPHQLAAAIDRYYEIAAARPAPQPVLGATAR